MIKKKIFVTGGSGFIGSNFIRYIINKYKNYHITNFDCLTYAGNKDNLDDVKNKYPNRYKFICGDICDVDNVEKFMNSCDWVINFAAETHVDRSICYPYKFIRTNIIGTHVLLEIAKILNIKKFIHISTDEVYGSIKKGSSKESDILYPSSPYSASKASSDLLVMSYFVTYKFPAIITRSSNNFGPYQFNEKLIPLFITNAIQNKKLPLYGDGKNIRNWIYVEDNCSGIDTILHKGEIGEIYNIGGDVEISNINITKKILNIMNLPHSLIDYVPDRLGHDKRYSLNSNKLKKLGWKCKFDFDKSFKKIIEWYKKNSKFWRDKK